MIRFEGYGLARRLLSCDRKGLQRVAYTAGRFLRRERGIAVNGLIELKILGEV